MCTCGCKNKSVEEVKSSALSGENITESKNESAQFAPACGCSADCTCGCQEGGECTCDNTTCACNCEKEQGAECGCKNNSEPVTGTCNCAGHGHGKKHGVRSENTPDNIADDFSQGREQLGLRGK